MADERTSRTAASGEVNGVEQLREAWFEGLIRDFSVRRPLYISDWTVETPEEAKKIAAATLFAYFTSVLPAVIFGDQLEKSTDGVIGLPEVLLSTGGMGILYSMFAGQGLVIVGVTGPVVFFELTVWSLASAIKAPFLQLNAWINIWCGVLHLVVAAGGYTNLVQRVTSFSGEIFGFFISVAYIYLGARNLVDLFPPDVSEDDTGGDTDVRLASAFASLVLAALMYVLAISCHSAKQWRSLNDIVRWGTQNYGLVVVLVVCTALSFAPIFYNPHIDLKRLPVPEGSGIVPSTSDGRRGWLVLLMGSDEDNKMEMWMVFVAILPAMMLLILFFFDHNVSSIMAQDPKFNLKKPPAFHFDFAVLGACVVLAGILGVPPGNGLIPQAPLHVRALAIVEYVDTPGGKREVYAAVVEKRWSNLLQSVLCLLSVYLFPILKLIPTAVLSGTFIYMVNLYGNLSQRENICVLQCFVPVFMRTLPSCLSLGRFVVQGVSGFLGNGLFDRLECMMMEKERRPDFDFIHHVPWNQIVRYTMLQFTSVVVIFFVSFNFFMPEGSPSVAIVFPLLIAVLIPLREQVVTRFFSIDELAHLDPSSDLAEDMAQKEADYERTKPRLAPEDLGLFQSYDRARPVRHIPKRRLSPVREGPAVRLQRSQSARGPY